MGRLFNYLFGFFVVLLIVGVVVELVVNAVVSAVTAILTFLVGVFTGIFNAVLFGIPYAAFFGVIGLLWYLSFFVTMRYHVEFDSNEALWKALATAVVGSGALVGALLAGVPAAVTTPGFSAIAIGTVIATTAAHARTTWRLHRSWGSRIARAIQAGKVGEALFLWAEARVVDGLGLLNPFGRVLPHSEIAAALMEAAEGIVQIRHRQQLAAAKGFPLMLDPEDLELITKAIKEKANQFSVALLFRTPTDRESESLRLEIQKMRRIVDVIARTREAIVQYVLSGGNVQEAERVLNENIRALHDLSNVRNDLRDDLARPGGSLAAAIAAALQRQSALSEAHGERGA